MFCRIFAKIGLKDIIFKKGQKMVKCPNNFISVKLFQKRAN